MYHNRTAEKLIRKHIFVSEDDWNWLREYTGNTIGPSEAIRKMLKKFRKAIEDGAEKKLAGE